MAAAKLNIKIEKGSQFTRTLNWSDNTGTAVSLTGKEARMMIRESKDSTTIHVSLDSTTSGIVLESGAVTGQIDITIGATTTEALTFDSGVYDLEVYDPLDLEYVVRLIQGCVEVIPGVTY